MPIWIDALCINQDDVAERSEQVQQMREVYSKAEKVICWAGPPVEGSDLALDWIRYFGQRSEDLKIGSTPKLYLRELFRLAHLKQQDEVDLPVQQFIHDLRESLLPRSGFVKSTAMALAELTARPYWSRICILQEVAAGNLLEFRCGDASVSEVQLHRATLLLRNLQLIDHLHISGWNDISISKTLGTIDYRDIVSNFKVRRAKRKLELMYLIKIASDFKASDDRDLIFEDLKSPKASRFEDQCIELCYNSF